MPVDENTKIAIFFQCFFLLSILTFFFCTVDYVKLGGENQINRMRVFNTYSSRDWRSNIIGLCYVVCFQLKLLTLEI